MSNKIAWLLVLLALIAIAYGVLSLFGVRDPIYGVAVGSLLLHGLLITGIPGKRMTSNQEKFLRAKANGRVPYPPIVEGKLVAHETVTKQK